MNHLSRQAIGIRSMSNVLHLRKALAGSQAKIEWDEARKVWLGVGCLDLTEKYTVDPVEDGYHVRYTNYRGETGDRFIAPIALRWGATDYHPQPQWLLEAVDKDRSTPKALLIREFALKDFSKFD